MTDAIVTEVEHLVDEVKSAFGTDLTAAETKLAALKTKYEPAFEAWLQQMLTIGETQGETILEQGLTDIGTVIATGGNPTAAIAALVPQVVTQVKTDLKTDEATVESSARNAAYTAIGLTIAALPAPAATPTPAPTPAAA
jgi:hypothetical protein